MTSDLKDILSESQDVLGDLDIGDALVREVLSYRLLIERLGETDNNGWWDSIVISDTGRARLEEVTPKTSTKAQIDLATKVGRKSEQDRLDGDCLSLFYLGPTMENQISAELENISEEYSFQALESLSCSLPEKDWTSGLVDAPKFGVTESEDLVQISDRTLDESDLKTRSTIRETARQCFVAYGHSTQGSWRVPFVEVTL